MPLFFLNYLVTSKQSGRFFSNFYGLLRISELINQHYFMNFFTGKRLLYLTEAPEVTPPGLGECFVNPKYINALGLRDAVRRPPLYTNRRPPRPYNPYNNKNNNDKLVIQRRKRNSRKRRSVLQESTVRLFWDFILHMCLGILSAILDDFYLHI